jgi:putative membrane protein
MIRFLTRILITMLGVLLGAWLLPGVEVESNWKALIVAFVLGLLNALVKPILIFLTIPATIVTFGLFLLVINAIIILMADWLVDGFIVNGFWWALLFSLILSILNSLVGKAERQGREEGRRGN